MGGRSSLSRSLCLGLVILSLELPLNSGFGKRTFVASRLTKDEAKGTLLLEDTTGGLHEKHLQAARSPSPAPRFSASSTKDDSGYVAMRVQDGDEQQEGLVYAVRCALLTDGLETLDEIQITKEDSQESRAKRQRSFETLRNGVPAEGTEGKYAMVCNHTKHQAQASSATRSTSKWYSASTGGQDQGGSEIHGYGIQRRPHGSGRSHQEGPWISMHTGDGWLPTAGNASHPAGCRATLDAHTPFKGREATQKPCQPTTASAHHGCYMDRVSRSDFEEVCTSEGHILQTEDGKDPDDQGQESPAGHESARIAAACCQDDHRHHRSDPGRSLCQRTDALGEGARDGGRGPRRNTLGISAEAIEAHLSHQGGIESGCMSFLAAILATFLMLGTIWGMILMSSFTLWAGGKLFSLTESAPRFRFQRVGCRRRSARLFEKDTQGVPLKKRTFRQKRWGRLLMILIFAGEFQPVLTTLTEAEELVGDFNSLMQGLRRWYGPSSLWGEDHAAVKVRLWPLASQHYTNAQFVKWPAQLQRDGDLRAQLAQDPRIAHQYGNDFVHLITDARRDGFDHTHARAEILIVQTQHQFGWHFAPGPCLGDYYKNGFSWRAAALIPQPEDTITVLLLFDIFEETHDCENSGQCRAIIGGEEFRIDDEIFEIPGHFVVLIESERQRDYTLSDASSTCSTALGSETSYIAETQESTPRRRPQADSSDSLQDDDFTGDEVVSLAQGSATLHNSAEDADPTGIPMDLLQVNAHWLTNTFTNRPAIRSVDVWHQLRDSVEGTISTTQLRFETPRFNWQDAVRRIHDTWHFGGIYWTMKEVRDEKLSVAKRAKALVVVSIHEHSNRRTGFVEVINCLHDGIQTTNKVRTFDVSATYDAIYHSLGLYSCIEKENCDVLVDGHDYLQWVYLPHAFTMQVIIQGGEVGQQMITPWVMLPFRHPTSFTAWRLKTRNIVEHLEFRLQTYHHWGNVYKSAEYRWQDLRARRWWMTEVHESVYNTPSFHEFDQVLVVSFNHAHQSQLSILSILETTPLDGHDNLITTKVFHLAPSQTRESILRTVATEISCDTEGATCQVYRNGHELNYNEAMRVHHGDFIHITAILQETCQTQGRTIQLRESEVEEDIEPHVLFQTSTPKALGPQTAHETQDAGLGADHTDGDYNSLMQLGQLRALHPGAVLPEWIYVYVLEREEPIMMWTGHQQVTDWQWHVANQVALRDSLATGKDYLTRQVWYQPHDLTQKRVAAFVAAKFDDIRRRVPILADLWWGQEPELALGDQSGFSLVWRRIRTPEFRSTREDLLRALGLDYACHDQGLQCQIVWREMIWRIDDRTIHELVDGDYVRVNIVDLLPQIPRHTQLQLLENGCNYADLQRRVSGGGRSPSDGGNLETQMQGASAEFDNQALMRRPTTGAGPQYPWAYGYFYTVDEPIRTSTVAARGQSVGRLLASLICARFDRDLADELRYAQVRPNPPDLEGMKTIAFVLVPQKDISPWQVITLVDVHFDTISLIPTGLIRPRSVRLIDYMVERDTLRTATDWSSSPLPAGPS